MKTPLQTIGFLSALALLATEPSLRAQIADSFDPNPDGSVWCVIPQSDDRVLAGGSFGTLAGESHLRLGRVEADGTPDSAFTPGTGGSYPDVYSFAEQTDGRILVSGSFTTLNGETRQSLGRLEADGTLDSTFNPAPVPSALMLRMQHIAVQPDGNILVAADFMGIAGVGRTNIAQLLPSGEIDPSFALHSSGPVAAFAFQDDGKIIVCGSFANLQGVAGTNIARLNADGTVDTNFHGSAVNLARCMTIQSDGKILLGGYYGLFSQSGGSSLGRLNADGSPDTSFQPSISAAGFIHSLAVQADGKIIVGGGFTNLAGNACTNIGRLTASGVFDPTFNPGANNEIETLLLQRDGKVLVNGYFTQLGGEARNSLGRLNNPDAATESLTVHGSRAVWMRGGSAPEVYAVTFEASADGSTWSDLGAGQRISGGWRSINPVPSGHQVRARGHALVGGYNTSSYLVPGSATATNTELVANGSFEFGSYVADNNANWMSLFAGATNIQDWIVGETDFFGVDWHDSYQFGYPRDGSFCVDLNTADTLEQTVTVPHSGTYAVRFYWIAPTTIGDDGRAWSHAIVRVEFGETAGDFSRETHDFLTSPSEWQPATLLASVPQGANTLRFTSIYGGGFWGPVIDDVSVHECGLQLSQALPAARSAFAGDTAIFTAEAASPLPLSYRWQKNGVDLTDDDRISGAATLTLTITSLEPSDSADYRLRVWNAFMETNSSIATLWIADQVSFADANLEQAVREALDIPTDPLTPEDLAGLYSLDAAARNITNLAGLEAAANLVSLNLSGNASMQDLAALGYLSKLNELVLNGCELADLTAVAGLQSLTSLSASGNFIQDLSPVSHLTSLHWLWVDDNYLTQIDPLLDLPDLEAVYLAKNQLNTNAPAVPALVISDLIANGVTVEFDPQDLPTDTPDIQTQPVSMAAYLGDHVSFSIVATAATGLLFQWQHNDANLSDGSRISGVNGDVLDIDVIEASDAGNYRVRVWNDFGLTNSVTVKLFVVTNVAFLDPNLELAVRDALDIPSDPLTLADLATLTWLDADWRGITNLSGIEAAAHLSGLNLSGNPGIADFTPLFSLPSLAELQFTDGCLTNATPLINLTSLITLQLDWNSITNPAVLTNLVNLESLSLGGNDIASLDFVLLMPNLKHLGLYTDHVADISPLAGRTNLLTLGLGWNGITNPAVLATLTGLEELQLNGNALTNVPYLAGLTNLTGLALDYTALADMSPVTNLTRLYWLNIGENELGSLPDLSSLTNLHILMTAGNLISDLSPVTDLAALTELHIQRNTFNSIAPLAQCTNLNRLLLSGNPQVTDLAHLADLPALRTLEIQTMQITNLAFLAGATNLEVINLTDNSISDLTPLASLTHLTWLSLWDNHIQDISPLLTLTNLTYVDLRHNWLDTSSGSAALTVIATLQSRGVSVDYDPQDEAPIVLSAPVWLGENQFRFTITSTPGTVLDIYRSTNLVDWIPFIRVTNTTGTAGITNDSIPLNCQFFRACQP